MARSRGGRRVKRKGEIPEFSPGDWYSQVNTAIAFIRSGQLKIKTKDSGLQPFIPNAEQNAVYDYTIECALKGIPCRIIILKSRQVGMTTAIAAFIYVMTSIVQGIHGLVAAHDIAGARAIWKKYQCYKDFDPREPDHIYYSKQEIAFEATGSGIAVAKAGADLGRGDSIQMLHASEYAFWDDPEETMETVMSCIPNHPSTLVAIESTGAAGTDFEHRFNQAFDAGGVLDGWKAFFFPWYDHAEYSIPVPAKDHRSFIETDDTDELMLMAKKVTADKINWRRHTVRNSFSGNAFRFKSQFPSTPDEAFSLRGELWFEAAALIHLENNVKEPILFDVALGHDRKTPLIDDNADGELRVYAPPIPMCEYVIGADAASEYSGGHFKSESALVVVNATRGEIVACWNGKINAAEFGDRLAAVGYWYNTAMLVPEAEAQGHSTVDRLSRGIYYPDGKLFKRRAVDSAMEEETNLYGWRQTEAARGILLDCFQLLVRDYRIVIPDEPLVQQMKAFVRNSRTGKFRAGRGAKDDLVISAGMALAVASHGKNWETRLAAPSARRKAVGVEAMLQHRFHVARKSSTGTLHADLSVKSRHR